MGSAPSSQSPSSPEPSPLPKSPKPCSSSQSAKTSLMGPSAYQYSGESRMNSACLGFASAAGVPDRGGDKATVVPIVLFGDVGGVLRSVHGRRACCARLAALVGVIAPIIQKPAITAITALPAGGYRNNSNSNSNSLFLSAPGPRKAAASLLLGQRVAIPGSCPVCQLASAAGATTCAPLPLTPPAPDARRPLPATRRITPPPTPRAHSDSRRARPQAWRRRQHLRHKRFCTSSSSRNQHD